jgi:outer membrane receptor protein involved in Fe transport
MRKFLGFAGFIIVILLFTAQSAFSQNENHQGGPKGQPGQGGGGMQNASGILIGNVIDKSNGNAVEYANVVLFKSKDSTMVTGVVTDNKGHFRIEKVPNGNFYVQVNFIGFKSIRQGDIMIQPDIQIKNLGNLYISPTSLNISGAEIKAEKEQMEVNLDKKVINVDKNLSLAGGTAIDVMQTIPSVTVDVEGTVSLRGSSNVTILIDGRPSAFTSLDQLPASTIDRVEIVTNPSARYAPDGMSGIINIVLKKKKEPGYNGLVNLNIGTHDKYMGSVNLNYRYNKINIFANYDVRYFSMNGTSTNLRESWFNDTSSYLQQDNVSRRHGGFHNVKAGMDIFINDFNTLSFAGSYHMRNFISSDLYMNESTNYLHDWTQYYERVSDGTNATDAWEVSMNYKKTFEQKNREWTMDGQFEKHLSDADQDMRLQYYGQDMIGLDFLQQQKSITKNDNYEGEFRTDYVQPVKKGRIETGYEYTIEHNNTNYLLDNLDTLNNWVLDPNTSNQFIYTEQVHAAYFIYSNSVKKFKYQVGMRFEEFLAAGNQVTQQIKFNRDHFGYYPTVHLQYEFNDHHLIQLSYSRRVNRPGVRQLNPFTNYSDPLNLTTGNPYLKPEYINAVELGYDFSLKSTNITPTIFYRQINSLMSRITTLDTNGVSHTSYENLNSGISYGIELVFAQKLFKWWKINLNGSYFYQKFKGDNISVMANNSYSWTSKINSTWSPMKGFDIQGSFYYNSPVLTASGGSDRYFSGGSGMGKMAENYWADLGIKKDFLKGALSLSFRISDVFKTQKYNSWNWGDNYKTETKRYRDSRVFFFGLSYKINGGGKKKRPDDMNIDFDL